MDRRPARYLGPLNAEPKPRRWPWLAILALGFLAAGWVCGSVTGRATGREWAAAHPCALAPGGAVLVREPLGVAGMLYTCSKAGKVMSRIPWVGEVAP